MIICTRMKRKPAKLLLPDDNLSQIPDFFFIQQAAELICNMSIIYGRKHALHVLRSDFFVKRRNAGDSAYSGGAGHQDEAKHRKRSHGNELGEMPFE